jgi:flagellar hook-associated protein 1 FlgK
MSQALDADQEALNVVANNVANANTAGYTEETPDWQENQPISISGVSYGQGVTETGSTSERDRVLESRLDQQQQLAASSSTRLTALDTLQALFTSASSSSSSTAGNIGSDITSFFNSFSSLEANPTENSLRQSVLSAASTLAGDISGAAASLNSQKASLDQEAAGTTSQVNALTGAIAQLNQQIQTTSPNADAGTLEDQRQEDLSQLSQLVGINQITTQNNGMDHFRPVAGLRGDELSDDDRDGERGHRFFCEQYGYYGRACLGRRVSGRLSDGAGHGHSQRAQFA